MLALFDAVIRILEVLMRVYMRIASRISPHHIGQTSIGFKLHCDTRDFIQRRVYYFNIYEPNLTHYILNVLKPGDFALDIGANVGYITLVMSKGVGETGNVVAIEASPSTFAGLQSNLQLNGAHNVTPLNMAATGGPCRVEVFAAEKNNIGANRIRVVTDPDSSVPGDALANIPEIVREKITFIKIDIEGSEAPVLEHILATLEDYPRLRSLAVEVSPASECFFEEFRERGFIAYEFPNNYRIAYLGVRHYLRQSGEDGFVVKSPASAYDPTIRDYVFERAV